ncbi:hypothetical protein, partial [Rhodothermus profundi]
MALYLDPQLTALLALAEQLPGNLSHPFTLGVLYLARHDAQGNVLWPAENMPPGWYRIALHPQSDSTYAIVVEDVKGRQATFPATLAETLPPSLDDAAFQAGIVAYGDAIDFLARLNSRQQVRFRIPRSSVPQPAPETDPVESTTRQALLQVLHELQQLGTLDSTRVLITSSDNVVMASALAPDISPLSEAQLQDGLSFGVFIAARKHPQRTLGEAVRFEIQRIDSLRYVLQRIDALGKTIAVDTLAPRPWQRPPAQALHIALAVGRPPEVCLAVPEGALCFFWPLTAAIPQEIAAVPGDGSVVLTW